MHEYIWHKNDKRWLAILIVAVVSCWLILAIKSSIASNYNRKTELIAQQNLVLKQQIKQKQNSLNYQMQKKAVNSSNSEIRNSVRTIIGTNEAINISNKAFTTLNTYSNGKQYRNNQKTVKPYFDTNTLKNQQLFKKDKDVTGYSYIDASNLKSKSVSVETSAGVINNDHLPLIIKTIFNQNQFNKDHGQTQLVMMADYNYKTKKIGNVKFIGILYQGAIDN